MGIHRLGLRSAGLSLAVTLSLCTGMVHAEEHLHEGDIEVSVSAGQWVVLGGHEDTAWGSGARIFEGDFGDFAGGLYKTDDPGYDSAEGTLIDGTILSYVGLNVLQFWDGAQWGSAMHEAVVTVSGNDGVESVFTWNGVTDAQGAIGQALSDGKIHEHLDMVVSGADKTVAGAYLLQFKLVGTGYADSDPFLLVLNRGLDAESFESSVMALTVPEPETYALMLAGLGLLALAARRRT